MTTPHINAEKGDFAETVLLPGDPLRAKYIAETFLEHAQQVNDVRNMLGFTGTYKGQQISVMGHGMGIPSCSIYCHELVAAFDVKKIIRVGSCGAINSDVKLKDIVIAMGASTDSKVNRVRFGNHDLAAIADYQLLRHAVDTATEKNLSFHVGNIFSADLFYTPEPEMIEVMNKYKILAMEMEAAGIYSLAMALGAQALAICTVSDHIITGEKLTPEERQSGFSEMIELALDTAIL